MLASDGNNFRGKQIDILMKAIEGRSAKKRKVKTLTSQLVQQLLTKKLLPLLCVFTFLQTMVSSFCY